MKQASEPRRAKAVFKKPPLSGVHYCKSSCCLGKKRDRGRCSIQRGRGADCKNHQHNFPCCCTEEGICGALSFGTRDSKALRSTSSLQSPTVSLTYCPQRAFSFPGDPAVQRPQQRGPSHVPPRCSARVRWVLALPLLLVSSVHTDLPVLPEHHLHSTLPWLSSLCLRWLQACNKWAELNHLCPLLECLAGTRLHCSTDHTTSWAILTQLWQPEDGWIRVVFHLWKELLIIFRNDLISESIICLFSCFSFHCNIHGLDCELR